MDAAKKSWVDQKTGEALGFDGKLASDGTIIPAPPAAWIDPGDGPKYQHLATQDINNPEIAHGFTHSYKGEVAEPGGLRYHWDRAKNSWVDDDTGNEAASRLSLQRPRKRRFHACTDRLSHTGRVRG